jgi:superfamily II DNA or RNA helicase
MIVRLSNRLEITNPLPAIVRYCKEQLILDNTVYTQKQRMGLYTGNTAKQLRYYQKDGDTYILPFGCKDDLIDVLALAEDGGRCHYADRPADFGRTKIDPYDYQIPCINTMAFARNGIFIAPTASGKTIIAMHIIARIKQKTLFLVNTQELLTQAKLTYEEMFDVQAGDIGIIKEGKIEIGKKITFALIQTLHNRDLAIDTFGCIIGDEVQFAVKSEDSRAMYGACMEKFNARYKIGCTASLHRASGQETRIKMLFGNVKYEVGREELSNKVMPVRVQPVYLETKSNYDYLKSDGTLDFCQLVNYLATNEARNYWIAQQIKQAVSMGHSCLVLCDRIAQIEAIHYLLDPEYSVMVTGTMTSKADKAARAAAMVDMESGAKRVLIASTKLAGTGLNIKKLDRLFWVSIQKDYAITIQAVGRIARALDGKPAPLVYDFIDKNIRYCVGAYNMRKRHYKKIKCEIGENK